MAANLFFTLVNSLTKCTPMENYAYLGNFSKGEKFREKNGNIEV